MTPSALRAGRRLGKYRIRRLRGEGGFARVFEAFDTIEGIPVAVKAPHPHLMTREALDWFRKEARLHAGLDHPNILPIKNADVIDGQFVVVYPLARCSLEERMRRRMGMDRYLDFARQMLDAVAYAHGHRIIHCDLKPDNFLVFDEDWLRLTDFSISRLSVRTAAASGSGTVGYVAPEQAMGRVSVRSDVFSLGLILYRMIAGALPEWPFEWPLPGHERLRRRAHPDFIEFLLRALDVAPARRFADAEQMLVAFDKLVPRMRSFARKGTRRGPVRRKAGTDWKQVRHRQFKKAYGARLGLDRACGRCKGPTSEAMSNCPWCGTKLSHKAARTRFPDRCRRCHRGRKADWSYCAWCYGPGFELVSERSYPDKRYVSSCGHCRGELMPFMRYCPWCRRKVKRVWKIEGNRDRCPGCGWGVVKEHWSHCPWCARRLGKP